MMTNNKEVTQVNDVVTDRWIKVIGLLIAIIGYFFITGQARMNASLDKVLYKQGEDSAKIQTHTSEISRNREDVKEVRDVQVNYGKRIFKLERKE